MLTIGWKAGAEQYPPLEMLDYAITAEQAGFESVDASDHFHPWAEVGQASFIWTWLGAAAARTSRIRLGTGLTCPILRYHPSIVAQASATLAVMAPGRTYLAVGTGEALNEYSSIGRWPGYAVRQEMMVEAVGLIRQLWTGEPVTHRGKHYQTRQARLYTCPDDPPPVYVSSMVPGSAEVAGRLGDGLLTVGGKPPEVYRALLHNFEQGARSAGKDPSRMPRAVELNVAYTEDTDQAISDLLTYWAGTFVLALFDQKIYTPKMSEDNGQVVGPDTVRKTSCISPDPEAHVAFVRQYVELGFNEIYLHTAGPDQRAFLEGYGRDVIPRLRELDRQRERRPLAA